MNAWNQPSLYQINTRIWLGELRRRYGAATFLENLPNEELDQLTAHGFDWIWFLGIWQTGPAGREVSRTHPLWQHEYRELLPDFDEQDVCGSPFAVCRYTVSAELGSEAGLACLRRRLHERGLRLMLDFVPNHTARDHPWTREHPEWYVQGSEADLAHEPHNYCWQNGRIFAHGRDPYFPAWPDTLQLNYHHAGLRQAMINELVRVAGMCDGVRCDMAMLLLPEVFERTWGPRARPADGSPPVNRSFWPEAIARTHQKYPQFVFLAEVYWDLEWELQQQGFAYTYDKRLYDRLSRRDAEAVRQHLWADLQFQQKLVRFLENHDEARAAAVFPVPVHQAAAVVTYLLPGLHFFHEGQLDGRRVRANLHLARRPDEPPNPVLREFYRRLLAILQREEPSQGLWRLFDCRPAWQDNPTWKQFLTFGWQSDRRWLLVVVNYGPSQGQCYVNMPLPELRGKVWRLADLLSPAHYDRHGHDLVGRGLYLDMPEWGYHVFEMTPL